MDSAKFYRASEIYSVPEVKPRRAKDGKPARKARACRRGLIPIGRTWFFHLRKTGKWPQPDAKIGDTELWAGSTIQKALSDPSTKP